MKTFLTIAALGLALALAPVQTVKADAIITAYQSGLMSTGTVAVAAATTITSLAGTNKVAVKRGAGIAVWPYFAAASGTSISNQIFAFQVSYDVTGTNWSTVASNLVATVPLPGDTSAVRGYALFSPAVLDNAKWIRPQSYKNTDNSVTVNVTNITYSYFFTP